MFDALLLTCVVDTHISDDTQAKFSDFGELVFESFTGKIFSDQLVELLNRISSEKRFNTCIAKCDVYEGLEEMDQILSVTILHILCLRVANE